MTEEMTLAQIAAVNAHIERKARRTLPINQYDNPGHPLHGRPVWRRETGLLEVHCPHGCGHPIPESIEWMDAFGPKGCRGSWGVHGCCGQGCCFAPTRTEELDAPEPVAE